MIVNTQICQCCKFDVNSDQGNLSPEPPVATGDEKSRNLRTVHRPTWAIDIN